MILVTGATGLLGNSIVRELVSRGESVRVLCRANSDRRALDGLNVQTVEGDLENADSVNRAANECSTVVHSGAFIHIGWQHLEISRRINVDGTRHVVEACVQNRSRLIYVSTVDTLPTAMSATQPVNEESSGRPKVPCAYVVSKTEAEAVVRSAIQRGLDALILHPGLMFGPYDWKPSSGRMLIEIRRAPVLIAPGGGGSVCDSRDVARAAVESIQRGRSGQNYILAGENLSYQLLWQKMIQAMGKRRRVHRSPLVVAVAGKAIDIGNRLFGLSERSPNGAEIAMGGLFHYYDSSKAERELDYRRRPLDNTLHDAWQWLQSR